MGLPENIDALLAKYDISQEYLARIAEVAPSAVSRWRRGSGIRKNSVDLICEHFNITPDDLLSDSIGLAAQEHGHISFSEPCSCIEVPYFGAIAAGLPISIDASDGTILCPEVLYNKYPGAFFLKVEGGSMNKVIPDGALALINPHDIEVNEHSIYAVCINGDSATLKRVRRLANGIELIPDSNDPTQRSLVFDYGEDDVKEVTIAGKLVWFMMPFTWSS